MQILNTTHKRKSAIITAIILMLLIISVFNFGMKYLDPPIEYGLAINLGNSELGSGEPVKKTKLESSEKQEEEVIEEEINETSEEIKKDDIITDNTANNAPVIENKKEDVKEVVKETPKKIKEKIKPVPKPKPSKETTDALNSLLNGVSKDGVTKGEGDDNESGVKGNENGDPKSDKYYGNSGSGSGGNYNLSGRKALSKPIIKPNCEEEGIIVVSIEVNKNGKVIKANAGGQKGSTNSAPCLEKAAKEAALKTKWSPDENAPLKQRGTIIYKFSLSE